MSVPHSPQLRNPDQRHSRPANDTPASELTAKGTDEVDDVSIQTGQDAVRIPSRLGEPT